ncbi:MAG: DMT family transporter [Pararhodobacter sp.]|nr:DMT family transporter [Pararhodobacter sp.]
MAVMTAPRADLSDWLLVTLLGLIWGGSFLGVALALEGFAPVWVAAARIGLAALVLVALAYALGRGLPAAASAMGRRIWAHCLGFALFSNVIPFLLLSWAIQHVSSGFAGITMAAVPLMVLPLAHLMLPGERLGLVRLAGFLLGFAGVLVLIGIDAVQAALAGEDDGLARLACIAAAACYAIGSINTRLCPPVSQLGYSAAGLLLAAVIILPVAALSAPFPASPGAVPLMATLYLGLLPTALATLLLVRINRRAGASFLSLVNYQVPVWAVVLGVLVLGEALPPQFLAALGLVLAGLALSRAPAIRRRP